MNSIAINLLQLSAENFNNWKFRVKCILEEKQIHEVIDNDIDTVADNLKEKFKANDAKA